METGRKLWICVQDGAREHCAIPRALRRSGRLGMLFTQVWAGPAIRRLAFGPLRGMAGRWHPELEQNAETLKTEILKLKIISWNFSTVWRQARLSLVTRHPSPVTPYARFVREGEWFSQKVRDYLARRGTDIRGRIVFSYDTTALELFRWAKERGAICVLGQMDPGRVEAKLVQAEEKRWPGWALHSTEVPEEYFQRREQEWALADRIIVNSRWSFDALVEQGVPEEKLAVIPLCFEEKKKMLKTEKPKPAAPHPDPLPTAERENPSSIFHLPSSAAPLGVLFLGQVILRKGIQYLIEAAKLLQNEPVRFDVVGPIGISDKAVISAPGNLTFHGPVGRNQTASWYERADVFVLSTISDGFAITQLEAMARGLPVIATPNCGEVVSDGVDGFTVPPRDTMALAEAIRRYLSEPKLLRSQRQAALEKSRRFTLGLLETNLTALEQDLKSWKRKM